MQIKIVFLFLILYVVFSNANDNAHSHQRQNSLDELNSHFPYGLLGNDYGILNLNDLAINACIAEPEPFDSSDKSSHSYNYWQCFENKNISIFCDSKDIADKYEGVMGLLVIKIISDQKVDIYLEHRLWPIKDCRRFNKNAKILLNGAKHVCFSGSFISKRTYLNDKKEINWNFERIKTVNGCEGRDCEFTIELKNTVCP